MAKVMVIAGGDWQIELVKKAKSMGHYVICSNLYEDSPAFPYADACEVANVLERQNLTDDTYCNKVVQGLADAVE